ncbi:methyltransferase [Pseudocolwellia sp. AS88]|uniref:class I SAM-dependent methyltransferase n=1 Tax=Pseudocolwellia sp. AS88 TaxID=3063958 RepID=UPI0026F2C6D6|nr:methyltransferase [Pseudocolwellia sp. AS88]MDO7086644.1 methyltransferase [Pseudocolwellia sp. AS88]
MTTLIKLLTASIVSASLLTACAAPIQEPSQLDQAIASDQRSDKNKARDVYRHPKETLEFFGFDSSMTVVEITPGGGWYTEILAPAVKGKGKLYGAHYPDTGEDNYFSNSRKKLVKMLASNEMYSEVELTDFVPRQESALAPKGTADLVLTFRNLHNWKEDGTLQVFKDAYTALKKGGVLGVVEHRMPESQNFEENINSGYFPEALAVKLALEAGFTLVETSDINANPNDTADHPRGVWTLPPVLRLGDEDKAKYLAIGESDRMTLKFIK